MYTRTTNTRWVARLFVHRVPGTHSVYRNGMEWHGPVPCVAEEARAAMRERDAFHAHRRRIQSDVEVVARGAAAVEAHSNRLAAERQVSDELAEAHARRAAEVRAQMNAVAEAKRSRPTGIQKQRKCYRSTKTCQLDTHLSNSEGPLETTKQSTTTTAVVGGDRARGFPAARITLPSTTPPFE